MKMMKIVNTNMLASKIAKENNISEDKAKQIMKSFYSDMKLSLKNNQHVRISKFIPTKRK